MFRFLAALATFLAFSPAYAQRIITPLPTSYALTSLGGSVDPAISYVGRSPPLSYPLVAGEHTTIIIIPGDSLASATDNVPYTTTHPTKVQDLSLENGLLYQAASPSLSCGGPGNNTSEGFWGHRLADKLIDGGKTARVIIACIGVNNTGTSYWITGPFATRIFVTWGRLNNLGLLAADRIFILTSIGGRDQYEAVPAATVKSNLDFIILLFRIAGFQSTPVYLAGSSWGNGSTGGENGVAVRTGIADAVAGNHNVFAGADTDAIPISERYDTNHYSAVGADHAATLWYNVIQGIFP